jgi:hypothetical protein
MDYATGGAVTDAKTAETNIAELAKQEADPAVLAEREAARKAAKEALEMKVSEYVTEYESKADEIDDYIKRNVSDIGYNYNIYKSDLTEDHLELFINTLKKEYPDLSINEIWLTFMYSKLTSLEAKAEIHSMLTFSNGTVWRTTESQTIWLGHEQNYEIKEDAVGKKALLRGGESVAVTSVKYTGNYETVYDVLIGEEEDEDVIFVAGIAAEGYFTKGERGL